MRIVVDFQGAQTESRFRGIGRYSAAFAKAIARNRGEHEVILALNGAFPETIIPIRRAFADLLPRENIRIWHTPDPVRWTDPDADVRRRAGEVMRAAFIESLSPDVVHSSSLFEGFGDDALTAVSTGTAVQSVSFYDLIPLSNPEHYLRRDLYRRFYFSKLEQLGRADLCLAISEYARSECLASTNVRDVVNVGCAVDGEDFKILNLDGEERKTTLAAVGVTKPFILFVGGADKRKNILRFLEAVGLMREGGRRDFQIVLVGKMPPGNVSELKEKIVGFGMPREDVRFVGYVGDRELARLYNLCDLFVFPSWQEGFGLPALEAMTCGAPVVAARTSSLPEVIGLEEALFDPFDARSMAETMTRAFWDGDFRERLRENAALRVERFSWDEIARRSISAFERAAREKADRRSPVEVRDPVAGVIDDLREVFRSHPVADGVVADFARAAVRNFPPAGGKRRILVDISELAQRDAATGIQRVTRSVLRELVTDPPPGYDVQPVYATIGRPGYRLANAFTRKFLGVGDGRDEIADYHDGDIFFGLDLQHHVVASQMPTLRAMRSSGVKIMFMVYDLLPILMPDCFLGEMPAVHAEWARNLSKFDGVVCISKAVADDYAAWLRSNAIPVEEGFEIDWTHLGADIENSVPSRGLPEGYEETLAAISASPSFLMVGTVEPRKGHAQVIEAFERIWSEGRNVNLVIVGKPGWAADGLFKKIERLRNEERRFFFLGGISDEYLVKIFSACSCLIAGSFGEGFGLPLIEAATRNIPIIARDIPVFREVAGDHAFYFPDGPTSGVAAAVCGWLDLHERGLHPRSGGMPRLSWRECSRRLVEILTRGAGSVER